MAEPRTVPFVKFSNDLLDAVIRSPMDATHKEVLLAVLRLTAPLQRGASAQGRDQGGSGLSLPSQRAMCQTPDPRPAPLTTMLEDKK